MPAIAPSSAARIRTESLLIALWAMGVAFIIGRALFAHVAVARLISRSRRLDADLRLDVDASIDVRLSHDVDGPFTLGALRPVITASTETPSRDAAIRCCNWPSGTGKLTAIGSSWVIVTSEVLVCTSVPG